MVNNVEILAIKSSLINSQPFWLYLLIVILSLYGFGLFVWWWKKMGKASAVYKYITFLLLGIAMEHSVNLYARVCLHHGCYKKLINCITSTIWSARLYLVIICIGFIVFHMSYRAFFKKIYMKG